MFRILSLATSLGLAFAADAVEIGLGWKDGWVAKWCEPPRELKVTETREPVADGFEKRVRRWEWTGAAPLEKVTLAVRISVRGESRSLKPFVPGVLLYGNPSNAGRTDGRVAVYAGEPGEFAIFEDHRLPMPFVLLEDARTGVFTAVHTVPSPIRGAKRADLWWSAGVEATADGADIVLLSGPVGYNRRRSVVKALQAKAMAYDETYVTLSPGQIVEKVYYVQTGRGTTARFGFEQAMDRALEIYRPYDAARFPSIRELAKRKRDYAMTRWRDSGDVCGFDMYEAASGQSALTMGWCGCAATCGWALPVLDFDSSDIAKAQRSLDFLATNAIRRIRASDGLFPVRFDLKTRRFAGEGDPVSCGQALRSFLFAIRHAGTDRRLDATAWRAFAEKAARTAAAAILKDDWPQPKSTNVGFYIAPLVLAADTFGADECLKAAEKLAGIFERRYFGYESVYWGGTLDASCEDKEGAYAAFQGYVELLDRAVRTGDKASERRYARLAEHAMDLMLTYTVVWDIPLPPGRLADHAFRSTGWTVVSAQNQHLDVFGVLTVPEIVRMGRYLKDDRLLRLADVMFRSCSQLTSAAGSLGEQVQHTNFAQNGKMDDVSVLRGGYSEHWTVFWLTAHFLNAAASLSRE